LNIGTGSRQTVSDAARQVPILNVGAEVGDAEGAVGDELGAVATPQKNTSKPYV